MEPTYNIFEQAQFSNEKYLRNELRIFQNDFENRGLPATYKGSPIRRHLTTPTTCREFDFSLELVTYRNRRFSMFVDGNCVYGGRIADFDARTAYSTLP